MAVVHAGAKQFEITQNEDIFTVDGKIVTLDLLPLGTKQHLLFKGKSYTIEVLHKCKQTGELTLSINGKTMETKLQNKLDLLIKQMGMEVGKKKLSELKAPMPGLVLNILVKPGDEVKEGETLVVLEAMKMENSLKAAQDTVIKSIDIRIGEKVDKNQTLISFE